MDFWFLMNPNFFLLQTARINIIDNLKNIKAFFVKINSINPANTRLDEDVLKTSVVFVFRRRLQDVFKASWSRRINLSYSYVFKMSLKCLQESCLDVFKTSCKSVFKTSSRRIQLAFEMYWKGSYLQDTLIQTNIFVLVIRLQDVVKTFPRYLQEIQTQVPSCEYCKIFKNNYFTEHLWTITSESWRSSDFQLY